MDTNHVSELIRSMYGQVPSQQSATVLLGAMIISNVMSLASMILSYLTNTHAKSAVGAMSNMETSMSGEYSSMALRVAVLERELYASKVTPPLTEKRLLDILNIRDSRL